MENISEKYAPKRGRPRKAESLWWQLADRDKGQHASHRGKANAIYGYRALNVLGLVGFPADQDARFAWLDQERRATILDALGRIADDQDLRTMALYLCAERPTTRQALALIRQFRLQLLPPGTAVGLTAAIHTAIETYLVEHADLPCGTIEEALGAVGQRYEFPYRYRRPQLPPARPFAEKLHDWLAKRRRAEEPLGG